VLAEISAADVS